MNRYYNFKILSELSNAMRTYNEISLDAPFTLLDLNILCLAKSFYESHSSLYMTNLQLAEQFLVSEKTVRNSINRLCEHGFLKKNHTKDNSHAKRSLAYQNDAVQEFIKEMEQ